ncbi:MAG: type II CAAX endopeptidase family protein [Clostridium sp.]|nr:type II CAAX endopeptidase family protein [Clostridium sp.]
MIRVFINKNKDIRTVFKISLFAIIYIILSGFMGQILLAIVQRVIGNNSLANPKQIYKEAQKYLYNTQIGIFMLQLMGLIALILTIFILLRFIENKRFKDIGFNSIREHAKELKWGLILGAVSMVAIFIILLCTGNITLKNSITSPNFTTNALWGIVLFIIVAINEEIMCRGYIQTTLSQIGSEWVAAIATSGIFAILHLGNPNVKSTGLINIFLVGMLLSYMYIKTKSIWMPIGYHFTWNYFQGNVFGFPVSGTTQSKGIYNIIKVKENILTGGKFGPEAGILATIVIVVGIIVVWILTSNRKSNN